jgi:hypothetical protein
VPHAVIRQNHRIARSVGRDDPQVVDPLPGDASAPVSPDVPPGQPKLRDELAELAAAIPSVPSPPPAGHDRRWFPQEFSAP